MRILSNKMCFYNAIIKKIRCTLSIYFTCTEFGILLVKLKIIVFIYKSTVKKCIVKFTVLYWQHRL